MKLVKKMELLKQLADKLNNSHWYSETEEGFEAAMSILEDAPTVDAIPIEWLKNELIPKAENIGATEYADNIRFVLEDWEAWKKFLMGVEEKRK